jgi:hypothetical protein
MQPLLAAVDLVDSFVKSSPQVDVLKASSLATTLELRLHAVNITDADPGNSALRADSPLGVIHSVREVFKAIKLH